MFSVRSSFPESGRSLRSIGSKVVGIMFRITLLKTLLVMDSSAIPIQFSQRRMFPFFFDSLKISPVFRSMSISSSSSHISLNMSVRISLMTSPPAFNIAELTPSAPGAFPDFMQCVVDFISFAVGGSMLTSRYSSISGMSSTYMGAYLLRMVSKCVFQSSVC